MNDWKRTPWEVFTIPIGTGEQYRIGRTIIDEHTDRDGYGEWYRDKNGLVVWFTSKIIAEETAKYLNGSKHK